MSDYTLISIKSKQMPGVKFAVSTIDVPLVSKMPSWYTAGSNGKYLMCDYKKNKERKCIRVHRLIMGLASNKDKTIVVDHINGDTLDNRRCNLRVITRGQNVDYRQGSKKNSASGIRGLHWEEKEKRWIARIMENDITIWSKRYKEEDKELAIQELEEKRNEKNERLLIHLLQFKEISPI